MQEQINQLEKKVSDLESKLTFGGMPADVREIIRNQLIKGENTVATLTSSYSVSGASVLGPAPYAGTVIVQGLSGKVYLIPYLTYE